MTNIHILILKIIMVLKTIVGNSELNKIWPQILGVNIANCQGILNDVLRHSQKSDKVEWRVLVVDKFSIKILNSTVKMHQLSAEGITRELPR